MEYDLTDKSVVINLLEASIEWLEHHNSIDLEVLYGDGPSLSKVLSSAIDIL